MAGARVFVHRYTESSQGAWLGPSVTDGLGRFAINGVPRGQYLVRCYVGKNAVWNTVIKRGQGLNRA